MKKTVFLSEKKPTVKNPKWSYQCPYIFYDKSSQKWREDLWYFNDAEEVHAKAKKEGYSII